MGAQFAVASLYSGTPLRLVQDVYDRKLCPSINNIDDLPRPVNQNLAKRDKVDVNGGSQLTPVTSSLLTKWPPSSMR